MHVGLLKQPIIHIKQVQESIQQVLKYAIHRLLHMAKL